MVGPYGSSGGTFLDGEFTGTVECSPSQGGGDTTAQPPSSSDWLTMTRGST